MTTIWINGEPGEVIRAFDRGLQYGDGLFETLAGFEGDCPWFDQHYQRLRLGCERLQLPVPDFSLLRQEVRRAASGQRRAVIKIILTSGSGGRGYARPDPVRPSRIVMRYPWPDYPADHWRRGVRVHHCRTTLACHPDLAAVKHLNRLEQVLARQEWQGGDSAEGLMRERAGNVIEGTMSNLFLVQNGVLHTPDLKDCGVHGIARRRILALATEAGIETAMGDYTPADLLAADELMLSNSLIGLWPVREYLNQPFGPGPVYRRLLAELLRNYPVINA